MAEHNLGISGAILQWCILTLGRLEGQRIARPSGLQPQWHHGSSLGSRWMGGEGELWGEASVFSPEDGEKKIAFPHGHWQNEMDLCYFFFLGKGSVE